MSNIGIEVKFMTNHRINESENKINKQSTDNLADSFHTPNLSAEKINYYTSRSSVGA